MTFNVKFDICVALQEASFVPFSLAVADEIKYLHLVDHCMDTKRMEEFVQILGRPIFLVDPKTDHIEFINGPGEELLGVDAKGVIGKSWEKFFDPVSIKRIHDSIHLLTLSKEVEGRREFQLRLKRKTGRAVEVNLILTHYKKGKTKILVFDLEDLSTLISLQKEKEALQGEMGRVSKLADIGRLTGGIAHELNNPLAIIQGLCENLEYLVETDQYKKDTFLKEMQPMKETINRMSRIIQSMMSVARGEEPVMEKLAADQVWLRASSAFESFAGFEGIKIINELNPKHFIAVDSIRVEQIFVNLVKNAIHALESLPAGTREIRAKSSEQKGQILIQVSNNGPSIPQEIAENLFTPFFTTKPVGQGFGLGLFLAYNVMKAHGGQLSTNNLKPQGVEFVLTFPRETKGSTTAFHNSILIVDDEPLFRQVFSRKLERMGYMVTMARNGSEAIDALKSATKFDLLITDYRMAGQDGAHLVEEVREFSKIPILFVTAFGKEEVLQKLKEKGVIQGIISKPIDPTTLLPLIEQALDFKRIRRASLN